MPVAECICADDSIMKLPPLILIYQALLRIAVCASSNPFITRFYLSKFQPEL